jgi:hypothetical protein
LADQKRPEALQNIRLAIRQSHKEHVHTYMIVVEAMP